MLFNNGKLNSVRKLKQNRSFIAKFIPLYDPVSCYLLNDLGVTWWRH